MAKQMQCPKCGSTKVQLSNVESSKGCIYFLVFGWIYLVLIPIKWCIGIAVFAFIDWWMAIVKKGQGKGYVYKCRRWFSGKRKMYYCHDCSHNFKG